VVIAEEGEVFIFALLYDRTGCFVYWVSHAPGFVLDCHALVCAYFVFVGIVLWVVCVNNEENV
jgi:hypothetical protein